MQLTQNLVPPIPSPAPSRPKRAAALGDPRCGGPRRRRLLGRREDHGWPVDLRWRHHDRRQPVHVDERRDHGPGLRCRLVDVRNLGDLGTVDASLEQGRPPSDRRRPRAGHRRRGADNDGEITPADDAEDDGDDAQTRPNPCAPPPGGVSADGRTLQTIVFKAPGKHRFPDTKIPLVACATSGLTVTFQLGDANANCELDQAAHRSSPAPSPRAARSSRRKGVTRSSLPPPPSRSSLCSTSSWSTSAG